MWTRSLDLTTVTLTLDMAHDTLTVEHGHKAPRPKRGIGPIIIPVDDITDIVCTGGRVIRHYEIITSTIPVADGTPEVRHPLRFPETTRSDDAHEFMHIVMAWRDTNPDERRRVVLRGAVSSLLYLTDMPAYQAVMENDLTEYNIDQDLMDLIADADYHPDDNQLD